MSSSVAGVLTVDKGVTGFIIIVVGEGEFQLFAAEIDDIVQSLIAGFGLQKIGKTFGGAVSFAVEVQRKSDIEVGIHPNSFFDVVHFEFVVGEFLSVRDEFDISAVAFFASSGIIRGEDTSGEFSFAEFAVSDGTGLEVTGKGTNLNRQIHATHETIGKPKVEEMKKRIQAINPEAKVQAIQEFVTEKNIQEILNKKVDYIIDAIDTVKSKLEIINFAKQKNIPIISSMGTANKLDPTKLEVTDIYKTTNCPLAKIMRKELRKREISNLKIVYSTEQPKPSHQNPDGTQTLGSISFVPSTAGLIIAAEVVREIISE